MAKLSLDVTATYCNRWPTLYVVSDGIKIIETVIEESKNLCFDIPDHNNHCLQVGMVGKHFGEDNVWDTASDEEGNIVKDLTLTLNDVCIDDVSIKNILLDNLYTVNKSAGQDFLDDKIYSDGTCNFNGYFSFKYTSPVMNSIINQKFKLPVDLNKSYFSNYTKVFHYEEDLELIKEIYEILDETKKLNC